MAVRIITSEETVRVNYWWELEACEEIKSPVFEVTDNQTRESKWKFSLRSQEDKLLIDLDFSSDSASVIQYSFYICEGGKKKGEEFSAHRGWGSGDLIKRQCLLVRNNFRDKLRIFCEIICKFNVGKDEPDIPECQLIDELNTLFDLKSSEEKSPLMELNWGKLFLDYVGNNDEDMKNSGDSFCNAEQLFNSSDHLGATLKECEDSICTKINIDNVLKIFTFAEAKGLPALEVYTVGFIENNIDHILAVSSLEDLEDDNPKLAATLLKVALNKINECQRRLHSLKSFLYLQ